jgi:murein L,D-transpeptidase YafK
MKDSLDPIRNTRMRKWCGLLALIALCAGGAILFARQRVADNSPVERIVIAKQARTLSTFRSGKMLKTYRVALGQNPIGSKEQEGDMKTPEGIYWIDGRNETSDFHLALHLSYPSAADRERAATRAVDAGCDIEIHGLPNGHSSDDFHPGTDWTAGCIAVTDREIEELWRVAPIGTPVEIKP